MSTRDRVGALRAWGVLWLLAAGCSPPSATQNDASTSETGPGADATSADASPQTDAGPGADARATDSSSPTGTCTAARLVGGNPLWDRTSGDDPDPAGARILPLEQLQDDSMVEHVAPLSFHAMVVRGSTLYTNTQGGLWSVDLTPSRERRVARRLAGGDAGESFASGPCSSARWSVANDMSEGPGGSLLFADTGINALFTVTDPGGPNCRMDYLVGTQQAYPNAAEYLSPSSYEQLPSFGDRDGPAATAQVHDPRWPVALADGTVYFLDQGNGKLKRVGTDAARSVATVAAVPQHAGTDLRVEGLTVLNNRVYLLANADNGDAGVLEYDPATDHLREVYFGNNEDNAWGFSQAGTAVVSALGNDGRSLLVLYKGVVFRLGTDGGRPVPILGEYLLAVDFPPTGYAHIFDEHPARGDSAIALYLSPGDAPSRGSRGFLTYTAGTLFVGASVNGSAYVVGADCL